MYICALIENKITASFDFGIQNIFFKRQASFSLDEKFAGILS